MPIAVPTPRMPRITSTGTLLKVPPSHSRSPRCNIGGSAPGMAMLACSARTSGPRCNQLFTRLRVVAGHAAEGLPKVLGVGLEARRRAHGVADDAAQPPPGDQRDQRQPVEVAGGVGAEGPPHDRHRLVQRPVAGHWRGQHRNHAGAADAVDLDAALQQRLADAQVGEATRAAACQHQTDRGAAEQPRHVAGQCRAQVHVVVQRPPVQPALRPAGDFGIVEQQHEVVCRFHRVEVKGDGMVGFEFAGRAARQPGPVQRVVDGLRIDDGNAAMAGQLLPQAPCDYWHEQ